MARGKADLPFEEYRERKISMLVNDFYLRLTDDEKDHFYTLETEVDVNAYAHKLLAEKL